MDGVMGERNGLMGGKLEAEDEFPKVFAESQERGRPVWPLYYQVACASGPGAAGGRPRVGSQTPRLPLLSDVCTLLFLCIQKRQRQKRTRVGNDVFRWVGSLVYFYTYTV